MLGTKSFANLKAVYLYQRKERDHNRFNRFEIFPKIKVQMLKETIIKRMPAIVSQPVKKR